MRNRFARGLTALSTVIALTVGLPAPTASALEVLGDGACTMYANSAGFGAYCNAGQITGGSPPSWREQLAGRPFIPCRDFPVPAGITLANPPAGKEWVLRLTIVDYDLSDNDGGSDAHLERAVVPVSAEEKEQCRHEGYMDQFWTYFNETYPDPVLLVKPTYTPRVNVPAYFALAPETSYGLKNYGALGDRNIANYSNDGLGERLTMQAVVTRLTVDPGDGTGPFECLGGTLPIGSDGYDEGADPFHQASTCSHVYKRSSAKQPDGMYTVKLTIHWEVSYWRNSQGWLPVGNADVNAVQRLPVQEVQGIGG